MEITWFPQDVLSVTLKPQNVMIEKEQGEKMMPKRERENERKENIYIREELFFAFKERKN